MPVFHPQIDMIESSFFIILIPSVPVRSSISVPTSFIDCANFHVHKTERQRNRANDIFGYIGRNTRRFFGPRNPKRAIVAQSLSQMRQRFSSSRRFVAKR